MPRISIVTPCFNEASNVRQLYARVREILSPKGIDTYEHIFIDNASRDQTEAVLRELAREDPNVKVILNTRNFGHIRSPHHALLQTTGDAAIVMAADFQDPPDLLPQFLKKWEEGYKVVLGVRTSSAESWLMSRIRKSYYRLIGRIADIELVENFTGFGLYDKVVVDQLRRIDDPYPYFRGLIADLGYEAAKIPFRKPARRSGTSGNSFYTLYDLAILGITSHSKVPLRLATMLGFAVAVMSFLVALGYLLAKLLFWRKFSIGLAPILIGLFFFGSVQLFFIGVIGEYIASIFTQVQHRPLVIEKERINF